MVSTPPLVTIILCIISFLICAIPSGLILAKRLAGVDVRTVGSGNIGSTNVARSAGMKVGLLTLLCDALKGALCTFASSAILRAMLGDAAGTLALSESNGVLLVFVYVACICGHCFSPYLNFQGGKGIAVGFGATLGFAPLIGLGLLIVFGVVMLATRYVSLASSCAAISLPLLAFFIYHATPSCLVLFCMISGIVLWRHKSNIIRLMNGEEKKFSPKKQDD